MSASLTTLDKILKDFYTDKVVSQLNDKNRFLKYAKSIDGLSMSADGRQVTYPMHIGRNTGVGAAAEGGTLPTAGNQQTVQINVPFRYNYGTIKITAQAIKQSQTSKGAFEKAVPFELKNSIKDCARDMNRQMFGAGKGILALVDGAVSSSTTTIAIDAPGGVASDEGGGRFLKAGDIISFTDGSSITATRTIVSVDSTSGHYLDQITIDSALSSLADNLYIVKANKAGATSLTDTGYNHEVMGLLGMIDDATYLSTYFGISRSTYPIMKGNVISGVGALALDDLDNALDIADQVGSGEINLMVMHHAVRREYLKLISTYRRYNDAQALSPKTGTKNNGLNGLAHSEVPIMVDRDMHYDQIFALDTDALIRYYATEGEWADDDGTVLMRASDGTDAYEARYRVFDNYVHEKPSSCVVLRGITGMTPNYKQLI